MAESLMKPDEASSLFFDIKDLAKVLGFEGPPPPRGPWAAWAKLPDLPLSRPSKEVLWYYT